MATEQLVGVAEIADLAGVTKQAVSNWRLRYDHFPRPIQDLQSGPVWDREQVADWVKSFRGEETHVLSFINHDKVERWVLTGCQLIGQPSEHFCARYKTLGTQPGAHGIHD